MNAEGLQNPHSEHPSSPQARSAPFFLIVVAHQRPHLDGGGSSAAPPVDSGLLASIAAMLAPAAAAVVGIIDVVAVAGAMAVVAPAVAALAGAAGMALHAMVVVGAAGVAGISPAAAELVGDAGVALDAKAVAGAAREARAAAVAAVATVGADNFCRKCRGGELPCPDSREAIVLEGRLAVGMVDGATPSSALLRAPSPFPSRAAKLVLSSAMQKAETGSRCAGGGGGGASSTEPPSPVVDGVAWSAATASRRFRRQTACISRVCSCVRNHGDDGNR